MASGEISQQGQPPMDGVPEPIQITRCDHLHASAVGSAPPPAGGATCGEGVAGRRDAAGRYPPCGGAGQTGPPAGQPKGRRHGLTRAQGWRISMVPRAAWRLVFFTARGVPWIALKNPAHRFVATAGTPPHFPQHIEYKGPELAITRRRWRRIVGVAARHADGSDQLRSPRQGWWHPAPPGAAPVPDAQPAPAQGCGPHRTHGL